MQADGNLLAGMRSRTRYLLKIEAIVLAACPQAAAGHIHVAGCDQGALRLVVDSGSWATRVRYQYRNIERALAQQLRVAVHDIRARVQPPQHTIGATGQRIAPRRLSDSSRKLVMDASGQVDHPALANALQRLARSARQ